jgi:hypothetical protein
MVNIIGVMNDQKGGKYLGEGADGCIFSAPGNWPCEKSLEGYNPNDKTLVTKLVDSDDVEGDILNIVKYITKKSPERYNVIKYVGKCKPKFSGFNRLQKTRYNRNIVELNKTKKACKRLLKDTEKGQIHDYTMYVLGKYEMTFKDFTTLLKDKKYLKNEVANVLYAAHFPFIATLNDLVISTEYNVINYDLHSKNIVVFKDNKKDFKPLDARTFQIGIADFGRSIWCKKGTYTFKTFQTWDLPYIEHFFVNDLGDDKKTFADLNQFSFDARLINYIYTYYDKINSGNKGNKSNKSKNLIIEEYSKNKFVKEAATDTEKYDIFLMYLPTFIEAIKDNKRYENYEDNIIKIVKLLKDKSPREQFDALKSNKKVRDIFDGLKKRSHLPTAFGVYVMSSLRACNYSYKEIKEIISNPMQTNIYVPEKMRLLLFKYINLLMEPFVIL